MIFDWNRGNAVVLLISGVFLWQSSAAGEEAVTTITGTGHSAAIIAALLE